nr:MAG TPA: Protein of unknown function (DUF1027) [Caudoviricetes sp.]
MPISEEFPLMEYCNMGGNIFQVKIGGVPYE